MNCRKKGVIYALTYEGCGERYIGETGMQLKYRMPVRRQQSRDPRVRCVHVSKHIDESGSDHFTYCLFIL